MFTRTISRIATMALFIAAFLIISTIAYPPVNADSPPAPGALYLPIMGRSVPLRDYLMLATSTYDGDSEIFTLRGDGSTLRRLTNNTFADEQPQWSPDGSQILWVQYSGVYPNKTIDDLWLMNSDGSNARPLTQQAGLERGSWSPDSSHIAYYNRNNRGDLYTAYTFYITTPSGTASEVLSNTYISSYQWSPTGSHLFFLAVRRTNNTNVTDLYTVAADGSNRTLIAQDIRTAQWAPDGTWLAFDARRDGDENVYLVRPDGSMIHPLTDATMHDRVAGWVENGTKLLLKRTNSDWGVGRYYSVAVTGGIPEPFILGAPTDDFINIEAIAPDGNAVVYSTVTNQGYLYLDWQATTAITSTRISPANCAVTCGVNSVAWSADGTQLTYAFWQQPLPRIYNTQVYIVNLSGDSPTYRVLDGNALNPVWLPQGYDMAMDATPSTGDASVRVPHIRSVQNGAKVRIPFIENADFITIAWRYHP